MQRNAAKELFQASDLINSVGRHLVQSDTPALTTEQLRDVEDELFGALLLVRQIRKEITPIHLKGQRA